MMLTKPNPDDDVNPPKQQQVMGLTLQQKREITLEWFKSNKSIRDFRRGEKLPRPFIRKAVRKLQLQELRKTEKDLASAEERIMSFRPGAGVDINKKPLKERALSIDQKREITLEWFQSDATIREFKSGEKKIPRGFIRQAANALGLHELRKMKNLGMAEDGVLELAEDKIKTFRRGRNDTAKGPNLTLDEKKSFVLEWFESDSSIRDFRSGEENIPRPFIRKVADALGLRQLRKRRGEAGVNEIAEAGIKAFHPKDHLGGSKSVKKASRVAIMPEVMQTLVMDWFNDQKMRTIPRFLKDTDVFDAKRQMMDVVKATPLRKLRKQRENDGVRETADAAVTKVIKEDEASSIVRCERGLENLELGAGKVVLRRDWQREAADNGYEASIKSLIQQWYDSEDMKSIGDFLQEKNAIELRAIVAGLVTRNGLRKLRKQRENPEAREKAMKKIGRMFSRSSSQRRKDAQQGPAKLAKSLEVEDDLAAGPKKEILRALLLEFYADDEMLPLREFLGRRDKMELQKEMGRVVKKLRLNNLRKRRGKLGETVTSRIEHVFDNKVTTGPADETKVEQTAPGDMDVDAWVDVDA